MPRNHVARLSGDRRGTIPCLARTLVRYDIAGFLLGCLILILSGIGLQWLEFSSDNRDYFGSDNPDIQAIERLEDVYAQSDSIILALVGARDLCTPQTLAKLRQFTQEAWLLPDVLRVDSVANFTHSYSDGEEVVVEPLVPEHGDLTARDAQRVRDIALTSPELINRLIAPDCRAFGVLVRFVPAKNASRTRPELAEIARSVKEDWQSQLPDLKVHVSGPVIAGAAVNEAAKRDILRTVPIALACVTVLMIVGLGTLSGWIGTMLITLGGSVATLGFAGWIGVFLIPATAVSPLAVLVLITASCVHVVLGWTRRLSEGQDRAAATRATMEDNLAAITVTNLTTAIGFLCLNFSQSPPLAQMGTIVSFGIFVGWALTVLMLPLILRRAPDFQFTPVRVSAEALDALARFGVNRRGVIPAFALLFVVLSAGLPQIRFNDSALRYFDESFAFRTDSDAIEASLTGLESVAFSLQSDADGSVFSPEFLHRVDRFSQWLRDQEKVVYVGSVVDIVKRLNQTLNQDTPDAYSIAPSRAANAQAMMFYELSLPVGLDMTQMLDIDRKSARLVAVLRDADGQDIARFADAAETWLRKNEPAIATEAVGIGVAFSKLTQRNNRAMLVGTLTALLLVSVLMIATLGDLKLGLVSIIPNLLPAIMGFGLWGWWIGDVNLGSTVVTTMTFGIVVDDTVHLLMHYQRHRRAGMDREDALRLTFRTVGTALMVTSIAICSGFLVMSQSGFALNQHLGGLTAVVILIALMVDLVLLPAILKRTGL